MSRGRATIKCAYPTCKERTIRRWNPELNQSETVRQFIKPMHRFYEGGWHERKLWTGWTRLVRLCKNLAASSANYEVRWTYHDDRADALVLWEGR